MILKNQLSQEAKFCLVELKLETSTVQKVLAIFRNFINTYYKL